MKRKVSRVVSIVVVVSLLFAMSSTVFAAQPEDTVSPQASNYISTYYASISGGGGSVTVNFDIGATGRMSSVGATAIQIKNSSGTTIKTFYSSSTSGMIGYNQIFHSGSVTYSGVLEGARYYAVVYFKAADSTGYDTSYYTTGYATA